MARQAEVSGSRCVAYRQIAGHPVGSFYKVERVWLHA